MKIPTLILMRLGQKVKILWIPGRWVPGFCMLPLARAERICPPLSGLCCKGTEDGLECVTCQDVNWGRHEESEEAFEQAEHLAPGSPKIKFERAKTYVRANRNWDVARKLLERYLSLPLTPDDPSLSKAQQLLNKARKG